jgi:putative ABC transport system substrate-binding protein
MIRRREFIAGLGSTAAWPLRAWAQQSEMPVVGWLNPVPGTTELYLPAFNQGLAETGFIVGRNVTITSREGGRDRLPALAADLVRQHVTVIAVVGARAAQVAKATTQNIPIVFGMSGDPVESDLVTSLNRPSSNLTGVSILGAELAGKRFEVLHKLVMTADSIAMLARTASGLAEGEARAMQSAARVLGMRPLVLFAATESELAAAFATLVEQHAALVLSSNAFSPAQIDQIISLSGHYAIPTLYFTREQVVSGGFASYGIPVSESFRQMGVYTGRILKGEKPADLPIMQPTKFEFVINLKTAKALGLTIPETLLATADEVIQ